MTGDWTAAGKTVHAVSLIEEACLAVLLDEREFGSCAGCVSTEVVAARSGLERWLGVPVSAAVVERILLNLLKAGKVERCTDVPTPPQRWRITESEADALQYCCCPNWRWLLLHIRVNARARNLGLLNETSVRARMCRPAKESRCRPAPILPGDAPTGSQILLQPADHRIVIPPALGKKSRQHPRRRCNRL